MKSILRAVLILPVLIGCARPIVATRIAPDFPNDASKPFCLERLGSFVFENIDPVSVKESTGREIGPFARHQFDSTLKSESGIRNCPEPDSGPRNAYRILSIDSIVFRKHQPANGLGKDASSATFTYQQDHRFTAHAFFSLTDSVRVSKGETDFSEKIMVLDYVQLQDAARCVAKDISGYITGKK